MANSPHDVIAGISDLDELGLGDDLTLGVLVGRTEHHRVDLFTTGDRHNV